ncbi:Rieske (2Fe-2S) protein [Streptomyces tritici]|uniref:Rieske (2Fe-2S) protein n=1 Tax=Streptomyces tritici TaxID=2054410 RepID=UPI003AF0F65E
MTSEPKPRRSVLLAGAGSLAALAAAGCDADGGSDGGAAPTPTATGPTASAPAGEALATTADIPVGGGRIFPDRKVVVTQPTAGEFKAFSAICTHQRCTVSKVANGTIDCPCHGSKFAVADGAVEAGPATRALPAARITVVGDRITLG